MSTYRTLAEAELTDKKVLLRAGFDVPMEDGKVTDTSRIEALVPTMLHIMQARATLIIMAHQDRPKGTVVAAMSQRPLVPLLEKFLKTTVHFASSCTGDATKKMVDALRPGDVLLLENLRFDPREEKNDESFARELAALADVYVNDAFPNCHRDHASMVGVPRLLLPFMGLRLEKEVDCLSRAAVNAQKPVALLISGAKMETKVPVIEAFLHHADDIMVGGAIANTFIAAEGHNVRASLCDVIFVQKAKSILEQSASGQVCLHVPTDVVVGKNPQDCAPVIVGVDAIPEGNAIYDLGSDTVDAYIAAIAKAKTIIWNGPLGLYESEPFASSSMRIAEAIINSTARGAFSVIGGGDTIDFHTRYGLRMDGYSFVSDGGGAMLAFVAGETLPALELLRRA